MIKDINFILKVKIVFNNFLILLLILKNNKIKMIKLIYIHLMVENLIIYFLYLILLKIYKVNIQYLEHILI